MIRQSDDSSHGGDERAMERAAAEWALRAQSGLRPGEQREFEAWLQRDARHAAIYAEMDETSKLLDQLREPALAAAATAPFELPFTSEASPARRRTRWRLPVGLAAAALVAVAWIVSARWQSAREKLVTSFATEVGVTRAVTLPDGSIVHLNTNSLVETAFTPGERRVRLKQGEAFFSVVKNPERPFWVDAGVVSVRAVGTAFNVRFRPQAVEVLVKEGKVSVNQAVVSPRPITSAGAPAIKTDDSAALLVAGEKATISLPASRVSAPRPIVVATVEASRIDSSLAWQVGRLEFTETPLGDVVAEFNRYNRHQLTIVDPALAAEVFGGSFAPGGYESLIEVLQQSFDVRAERHGNQTILRRGSASRGPR